MIVIASKYLIPKGYDAITLYPFIFVRDKQLASTTLLNHERIHLRQQAELLIIFFYVWYGAEYCIRLLQYKNKKTAYYNISFEREAYACENNLQYLKNRSAYKFTRYIKH